MSSKQSEDSTDEPSATASSDVSTSAQSRHDLVKNSKAVINCSLHFFFNVVVGIIDIYFC